MVITPTASSESESTALCEPAPNIEELAPAITLVHEARAVNRKANSSTTATSATIQPRLFFCGCTGAAYGGAYDGCCQ